MGKKLIVSYYLFLTQFLKERYLIKLLTRLFYKQDTCCFYNFLYHATYSVSKIHCRLHDTKKSFTYKVLNYSKSYYCLNCKNSLNATCVQNKVLYLSLLHSDVLPTRILL